jgi:hypothetical protein
MLDSHYRPLARINIGVRKLRNTFYAIFLRHFEQCGERLSFRADLTFQEVAARGLVE